MSGWLQALALVLPTIICVAGAAEIERTRRVAIRDAEVQISRLSLVLAEQTGRAIETVYGALRSVGESADLASMKTGDRLDPLREFMREDVDDTGPLAGISIVDASGRVLCSTFSSAIPVPPAQKAAVLEAITPGAKSTDIGKPFRDATGHWAVLVTRRLDSIMSGAGGYALGFVNLRYFERFYEAVQLPKYTEVALLNRDGTLLVRYPHDEAAIGRIPADVHVSDGIVASIAATAGLVGDDGSDDRRIQTVREVRGIPIAVNISLSESHILRSWQEPALVMAGLAISASLIIGSSLLMLARRARQREALVLALSAARRSALHAHRGLAAQMAQRERDEDALRQTQRLEAVGKLSSGAAHDFNNLLTVVITNLEMLLDSEQLDGDDRMILTQAHAAAGRGAVLTKQLLAFSRQQPLCLMPVDLQKLVLGMKDLLHTALGDAITLKMHLEAGTAAMADANQLELMVLNLAINAHDAMPNGGTLDISTHDVVRNNGGDPPKETPYVLIAVTDTGAGMAEGVRSRAFDPFFTTKPPGAGSGLGLSQVYGLARQSGGLAEIESTPDLGTTVRVWLPRAVTELPAPIEAVAKPAPKVSRHATILVVDDDAAVRNATVRMLRRSGYTVLEDGNPQNALDRLTQDTKISMVISDIVMPGMNGLDLAATVHAMRPDLPFMFISGYADPANVAAATEPVRILRKPFRSSKLIAEIEAVLAEKKAASES